jgi:hypothetical protein
MTFSAGMDSWAVARRAKRRRRRLLNKTDRFDENIPFVRKRGKYLRKRWAGGIARTANERSVDQRLLVIKEGLARRRSEPSAAMLHDRLARSGIPLDTGNRFIEYDREPALV